MKTLRFGLLGLGYFGRNYLRLLQRMRGVELAAVAARTQETLSRFKSVIPKAALKTTNALAILENPDIDCVVIATPPSTHLAFASQALRQGKHVLVEKPMVPSLAEAKKLKAAVSKSNSTFMVGHQYVYNDYVRCLKRIVEEKSLGTVNYVVGEHLGFLARRDIGCLWDAGPHQLSMLQYLFNPGKIAEVIGSSAATAASTGFEEFASAAFRFESGLLSIIVVSCSANQKTRKLTIVGDRKAAVFDDVPEAGKLRLFSHSSNNSGLIQLAAREPLLNEVEHFVRCVSSSEKPLTGIDSSYAVTEWLDKIARSAWKKQLGHSK